MRVGRGLGELRARLDKRKSKGMRWEMPAESGAESRAMKMLLTSLCCNCVSRCGAGCHGCCWVTLARFVVTGAVAVL
eukprot:scaffold248359_cov13-Tisochrysis_lutea.AAC.1